MRRRCCLALAAALLVGRTEPQPAPASPQAQTCTATVAETQRVAENADKAGLKHVPGMQTCLQADDGGALVTSHFLLARGAELLAELREVSPPKGQPTTPEGELLRSPLLQPAAVPGCGGRSAAAHCPTAVLVSLPTAGPRRSYTLRIYAAPGADGSQRSLPMALELSLALEPVPWRAAAPHLPSLSTPFPTPFAEFAPRRAVLTTPLRRYLAVGARYNFEVSVADALGVAVRGPGIGARWAHLAPAEGQVPKDGMVRWRGSAAIRKADGLMLMAKFVEGDNYDVLLQFEGSENLERV